MELDCPFPAVRHIESRNALHCTPTFHEPGSQRAAQIWRRRTLKSKGCDFFLRESPLFLQVSSMGWGQLQQFQHCGVRLMNRQCRRTL